VSRLPFIPFSLIFYRQTQVPSGLAAILNATALLWTVLLAHWLTRDERLTPSRLAGVLIGFVGVVILLGPALLDGMNVQALAQLAVVGAAVSYAFAGIFGKGFRGIPPLVKATGQVTATAAMILPVALLVDQPWTLPAPSLVTWGTLIGLALLIAVIKGEAQAKVASSEGPTSPR
jgi:drug/metabolite transporter (DMT)-like permease